MMILLALAALSLPQLFYQKGGNTPHADRKLKNSIENKLKSDRKETQIVLRNALLYLKELEKLSPELWAKSEWSKINQTLERGQLHYRTKRYESASRDFQEVTDSLTLLIEKAPSVIENLIAIGDLALQTDNSAEAQETFRRILKIQPRHPYAEHGLARALNLDKVSSLLAQGMSFEKMNQLDAAKKAFLEAARLDPESTRANAAIKRLEVPENEKQYSTLLSLGYQKLNENQFDDAEKYFISAFKVFGNREVPMKAIELVKNTKLNHWITDLDNKAARAKKEENWQKAFEYYSEILGLDSSLNRAVKEKAFAKRRIELENKISDFLDKPSLLFDSKNLTDARTILTNIRQEQVVGPKLSKKISSLEEYIMLSDKQKKLIIRSDNVTEVWLGKNISLGFFKERTLELKPGEYTLYGFRDSFSDTSKSFEIKHQEESKSIEISCQIKTR